MSEGEKPCRHTVVEYDWQGRGTCRLCWRTLPPAPEVVHLIAYGEAVTSCCGRTPFELPRTERITVDPKLGNCEGKAS